MKCLMCHNEGVKYENISDLAFHLTSVHKIESAAAVYMVILQDTIERAGLISEKQALQKYKEWVEELIGKNEKNITSQSK